MFDVVCFADSTFYVLPPSPTPGGNSPPNQAVWARAVVWGCTAETACEKSGGHSNSPILQMGWGWACPCLVGYQVGFSATSTRYLTFSHRPGLAPPHGMDDD